MGRDLSRTLHWRKAYPMTFLYIRFSGTEIKHRRMEHTNFVLDTE